ncbi:GntG family PLP-dependent aldolase [Botrimarina sp.]|uniref:threonine aldolase family protein n=1 Tax=Botrimarina sp. TaxID=2795802 RepID=UPI0032ECC998
MIDLRSDTVTRPTPAMREAMATARVGDDVLGDDPTVAELEARVAELLGKPAALFVPSGTMSNQLGVRVHCQPGDELVCDTQCHIYNYEQGAYAQLFGVAARPLDTPGGVPTTDQLDAAIRPDNIHFPRTRLLCLENTHNRWGGRSAEYDEVRAACELAAQRGLARHLDGARLWNAAVASGRPWSDELRRWGGLFDTVSVCFSKGLGAPVGSALCGPADLIRQARRTRKALGGGMRQAGVIAAAALYALEHHVDRLADDHRRAHTLAQAVRETPGLSLVDDRCDTNLVLVDVDPSLGAAAGFAGRLAGHGVGLLAIGPQRVRAVTHLDVDDTQIHRATSALRDSLPAGRSSASAAGSY